MKLKNFKQKILPEIEKRLKIKVKKIEIPLQGMESSVFDLTHDKGNLIAKCSDVPVNDILAYKLINKLNLPTPKVYCNFKLQNYFILVLEKINFSLLTTVPDKEKFKYIPSMLINLKKIHKVKSQKTGFLNNLNKFKTWKDFLLAFFDGKIDYLDWEEISERKGLSRKLVQYSVDKIINKIQNTKFLEKNYSLLHTDFNQRNLFVDPKSKKITGIIDWAEAMFGDPLYDFARVRMFIWHFKMKKNVLDKYYKFLKLNKKQKEREELYFVFQILLYLAWYSEELIKFNIGRIRLHQGFLENYRWN